MRWTIFPERLGVSRFFHSRDPLDKDELPNFGRRSAGERETHLHYGGLIDGHLET